MPAEDHLERLAPLVGEWDVEAVFREENFPRPAPQDARGVARLYVVEIADGLWTLKRTEADFTPLDFAQRFTGERHGDRIDGRWFRARRANASPPGYAPSTSPAACREGLRRSR